MDAISRAVCGGDARSLRNTATPVKHRSKIGSVDANAPLLCYLDGRAQRDVGPGQRPAAVREAA